MFTQWMRVGVKVVPHVGSGPRLLARFEGGEDAGQR